MARTVGRVKNLVVEDGEVEGETKTDGVGRGEISLGNIGGVLIVALAGVFFARIIEHTL